MNIVIREMKIEDYDEAIALWEASEGVGVAEGDSREEIQRFLIRNPGFSFSAYDSGILVGTVLGGHDGRRGYITHMAVHSAYRSSGIARELEEHCMIAFREAGIHKCHIHVYVDNHSGIAFWDNIGWQERTELVVMSKYTHAVE
jgi:N-acetylglutamate synthase